MRADYKDKKGVISLMVGDTQNTLPYENNEDLFRLLDRVIKGQESTIDVYDFEDKFVYFIFNSEDIEELKKELS